MERCARFSGCISELINVCEISKTTASAVNLSKSFPSDALLISDLNVIIQELRYNFLRVSRSGSRSLYFGIFTLIASHWPPQSTSSRICLPNTAMVTLYVPFLVKNSASPSGMATPHMVRIFLSRSLWKTPTYLVARPLNSMYMLAVPAQGSVIGSNLNSFQLPVLICRSSLTILPVTFFR